MALVQSVVVWAVTGLAGSVAGWFAARVKAGMARDKALESGVRELLLCQLEALHSQMVEDGGCASDYLKARSQRIYDIYHDGMGGNGHGTSLNDDIQHAPVSAR